MKPLQIPGASSSRLRSLGVFLTIVGAAGFVAGSGWMSFQFIVDPKSVAWLNQYLPERARIPLSAWDDPKTLAEVQADLTKQGLTWGELIRVESGSPGAKRSDLLMPVFKKERLTELRVYRKVLNPTPNKKEALQFINILGINELDEAYVIDPLSDARVTSPGGDTKLPFTTVDRSDDRAPNNGIWLSLSGTHKKGDANVTYGSLVHYSPVTTNIGSRVSWTSPQGQVPTWQKVAKGRPPELLVNRTVALEPDFQVYQLKPRKSKAEGFQLQPISLTKPWFDHSSAFADAVFLARNGLWSPALEMMQSVRKQRIQEWTITAQAQVDFVERHAKVTKAQADQPWASASQQVLVNLIDGRWAKATQLVQSSAVDRDELLELLKFDANHLQKRIDAALHLNPARTDVQTWAALRIAVRQGKADAIAWLKKQPQDSNSGYAQNLKLLNQLDLARISADQN